MDPGPFVVDSCVWIDLFEGRKTPATEFLARGPRRQRRVLVPHLVAHEVLRGAPDEPTAERILRQFALLRPPPDLETRDFYEAAALYRRCRTRGRTVCSVADCLIAQLCLRTALPLLTSDRDFEAIAAVAPLKLIAPAAD